MSEGDVTTLALRGLFGVAIGAVVGSFAATAALRMAKGRSPFIGRSACDGCARTLKWAETVPFVGYVAAKGQCRTCGDRIAPLHLMGEMLGAIALTVPLFLLTGWTGIVAGLLCLLMLIAALIDVNTLRLPDVLTAGIALCAIVLAAMDSKIMIGLASALAAAVLLYAGKWYLERRHGKAMLGMGDVKLVAALALWLNLRIPAMLALAAIIGLIIIKKHKGPMPFGPAIAASAFILGVLVPEGWLV